jgi:hypothetical protein
MHEKGDVETRDLALRTMADMQGLGINLDVPMGVEYNTIEANNWGDATFGEPQSSLYYYKGKPHVAGDYA